MRVNPQPEEADSALPQVHVPMMTSLILILVGAVLGFILGVLTTSLAGMVETQIIGDFIAPTAAQARDQGWVNISEKI